MRVYGRAIEVLRCRGWYQGEYADPDHDKVCLLGAINVVVAGDPWIDDEIDIFMPTLATIIKEQFPDRIGSDNVGPGTIIPAFNDHIKTKLDDVIMVLDKAQMKEAENE